MSYESYKYCNGDLYVGIAKDVKNQQLFIKLYAGIAMDVWKIGYYLQDMYYNCIFEMALWKLQ